MNADDAAIHQENARLSQEQEHTIGEVAMLRKCLAVSLLLTFTVALAACAPAPTLATATSLPTATPTAVPTSTATYTATPPSPTATATPIAQPTKPPTATPIQAPTKEPTAAPTVDVEKTAIQKFNANVAALAPSLEIDPGNQIDKKVPNYYESLEQVGWIRILRDSHGRPAMFVVTKGQDAVRSDMPQYFINGVNIINKYDPQFMAALRDQNIISISYDKETFDKTGFGSTYYLNVVPYGQILINRDNVLNGYFNNDIEAVGRILHEAFNIVHFREKPGYVSAATYKDEIQWLQEHVPPNDPVYNQLKAQFDRCC